MRVHSTGVLGLAGCLVAAVLSVVAALLSGEFGLLYFALMFVLLALPVSAIYACDAGWPRQAMMVISAGLLGAILLLLGVGLFDRLLPPSVVNAVEPLIGGLPLAMLASQFAAIYLTQVKPQK